ncbi:ae21a851-88ca-40fd-adf8-b81d5758ff84-CDS [Sclerotinia trifoliorum]|uniref:Ae21a851-88ca-40fd-adf8-b81d5758ff84-CDS n=1 Tax=Sclerotinia trifoliorum TaxID=28548 RepID=A0A8H2W3R4_9HELO|nr:ae21a851-88ca-40fd-adf8-b81d5758ff84-CDS [Sclerotinia trifoliorum]
MRSNGSLYGPSFQAVRMLKMSKLKASGSVKIPDVKSIMPSNYMQPHIVHPNTLDALLHTSLPLFSNTIGGGSVMPVSIGARSAIANLVVHEANDWGNQHPVLEISELEIRGLGESQKLLNPGGWVMIWSAAAYLSAKVIHGRLAQRSFDGMQLLDHDDEVKGNLLLSRKAVPDSRSLTPNRVISRDGTEDFANQPSPQLFQQFVGVVGANKANIRWISAHQDSSAADNPEKGLITGFVRSASAENAYLNYHGVNSWIARATGKLTVETVAYSSSEVQIAVNAQQMSRADNVVNLANSSTKEFPQHILQFSRTVTSIGNVLTTVCESEAAVSRRKRNTIEKMNLPPVKGIVQSATVLQDVIIERMTFENFMTPREKKLDGTAYLLDTFKNVNLEFFIMISSLSGVIGTMGQANYDSGTLYQDTVAQNQKLSGTPVVSLDLGLIKNTSVYDGADDAVLDYALSPQARKDRCKQVVLGIDGVSIAQAANSTPTTQSASKIGLDTSCGFGLDSLTAIELKNWIGNEFDVAIQASEILDERSVSSLAVLPVPDLPSSPELHLASVQKFISETQLSHTVSVIQEFINGPGAELQKRLVEQRKQTDNWLHAKMYLQSQRPLNPYSLFHGGHVSSTITHSQAERAAIISLAAWNFKQGMDTNNLEQQYLNEEPLCMDSLKWIFNAKRIPQKTKDEMHKYADNDYFVVLRRSRVFKARLAKNMSQESTYLLLKKTYLKILHLPEEKLPAVATLTADERISWAQLREIVKGINHRNSAALEHIEASKFVICLDDGSPETSKGRCNQYLYGSPSNRWSDKLFQLVVCEDGTSGFICEPMIRPSRRMPFETNLTIEKEIQRVEENFRQVQNQAPTYIQFYVSTLDNKFFQPFKVPHRAGCHLVIQIASLFHFGKQYPCWEALTTMLFRLGRID